MSIISNSSIRRHLILIIMLVSCISVVITTVPISIIGVINLENNIREELDVSASIVGDRNISALEFDVYDRVNDNLGVLSVKQQITLGCLYDKKIIKVEDSTNTIIDTTGEALLNEPQAPTGVISDDGNFQEVGKFSNKLYNEVACPSSITPRMLEENDRIKLMKPLFGKDKAIAGYIYLESTLESINVYIKKQIWIASTVALTAFLVSYLLAISLQRRVSNPILQLSDIARQVTERKDYSIRAKQLGDPLKNNKNELVILTHSFNNMLSEIGSRDQQLKQQNTDLEKARDAAEGANLAKSQFLANISHELRTPLNAIIGFSSIFMNQLFGPLGDQKYLEYANDINESGIHLLEIINDILDLSKAEAGKLTLNFEDIHVAKAIQKCVSLLSDRATKANVTIHTDVPKHLPLLEADRLRFVQIVLNILSNAVKFTSEAGHVYVSVETKGAGGAVTDFVVTIRDTGIGMSPEDLDKAFQSFGQVDSGLNRKYEGTGLGLPLTQKLLELHNGSIKIESELGKGTTVYLTFPATVSQALKADHAGFTAPTL